MTLIPIERKSNADVQKPSTRLTISKNYVVPPRPKPGRKPSADTPPSKRKMQNRESQRLYRERKATAVKELESQLADQAAQFEKRQKELQEQIDQLRKQNHTQAPESKYSMKLSDPQQHRNAVSQFGEQRGVGGYAFTNTPVRDSSMQSPCPSPGDGLLSIARYPLGPVSPIPMGLSPLPLSPITYSSLTASSPPFATPMSPADVVGLELLDHVLDQKLPVTPATPNGSPGTERSSESPTASKPQPSSRRASLKRGNTPSPPTSDPIELMKTEWSQPAKPLRRANGPLEIDFTNKFRAIPRPLVAKADKCGFCSGGNVCVCAEAALREAGDYISDDVQSPDVKVLGKEPSPQWTMSSPLAGPAPYEAECSGDPGACEKCREDPMLSLFCAAVAAKKSMNTAGTFISPLQAYKTLKRHPRFLHSDLGVVVGELSVGLKGQVDVGSIARCLRKLDAY